MSYGRGGRQRQNRGPSIEDQINKIANKLIQNTESILNKTDIELFLDLSEEFGELCNKYAKYGKRITTSQMRGIFQEVKRLPDNYEKSKRDLNLLRPKLAYQKGRFDVLEPLTRVLIHMIKNVKDDNTLEGFKDFFEAIIAYHKAYGGRE